MISIAWAFEWLIAAAVMSLVISAIGSAAALCCGEPVRRMRVITLALAACLLAPMLAFVPGLPRWSWPAWAPVVETAIAKPQAPAMDFREPESQQIGDAALFAESMKTAIPVSDSAEEPRDDKSDPATLISVTGEKRPGVETHGELSEPVASPATRPGLSLPTPAVVASSPGAPAIDLRIWVIGLYLPGLSGLSAWWLVGFVALRRVLRAARPAPEWCREILREIAGPAGERVKLLVSSRAAQPFTYGWRRAVIVLPAEMCRESANVEQQFIPISGEAQPIGISTTPQLRWSLAHEWAHVVHKDVCVWSLAGLVRTVYFYQPLCWWLRGQLRLCQDYLADAAAAREISPEAYAEFLASRASGQALAYGLGIAGGKSDLYRRVAMLVKNRRPLETRCPWWWSTAAASAAIVLMFFAATFANKPPLAAAADRPRATAAEDQNAVERIADEKNAHAKKSGDQAVPGAPAAERAKAAPAKVEKESGDPARQKILEGLFARATAIKSGRFKASVEWGQAMPRAPAGRRGGRGAPAGGHGAPAGMAMSMMMRGGGPGEAGIAFASGGEIELIVSGESWLQRPGPTNEDVFINHAGRSLSFRDRRAPGATHGVTIYWPEAVGSARYSQLPVPVRGGTIWYPESVSYLREHAAMASLAGNAKINGVEVQVVEWKIPAADAERAFADAESVSGLLGGGGTYRVYVSRQLDYSVARIECIDRFGTAQSVFDFSQFKKVAAGIYFPHQIEIREGPRERTMNVLSVDNINERIEEREFVLHIPPGTQVEDVRPHEYDNFRPGSFQRYDPGQHPLRSFTTGAEYPEGLPAAMLAEMDRDALSPEEAGSRQAQARQPGQKVSDQKISDAASTKKPESTPKEASRRHFTYGGKSLDAWGEMLLEDLEPDTRIKALTALGAFATNGYGEEVAAAIGELLKNDGSKEAVGSDVQAAACAALVHCGSPGVPVLERQLESEAILSRRSAVHSLAAIVPSTEAVAAALLKAAKDRDSHTRGWACHFLARNHPDRPAVADALAQAVHDETTVRLDIVTGLSESRAAAESVVALVRQYLGDEDRNVRSTAAAVFAARVPDTDENSRLLRTAVLDGGSQARKVFVEKLHGQQQSTEISPELTVPLLLALLESRESYQDVRGDEVVFVQRIFGMIDKMPPDNAAARAAIPVLIKTVNLELPDEEWAVRAMFVRLALPATASEDGKVAMRRYSQRPSLVLAAAESLGRFGPAAKDAVPSLKKLLEPGWSDHHGLQDVRMETEKQWQTRIQAIIDKIEAK